MFKPSLRLARSELGTIDIAPLIDVVFQLLIFFMLTSSFVYQPGIKIHLPKAITSEVLQEESLDLAISAENVVYFNNAVVTPKELAARLRRVKPDQAVLIKADRKASLGRVVEIWDLCREAGITHVNIATTQPYE